MKRVAVIGNGGGGKSTLARTLSTRLGIPHHEVDRVQFRPDWSPAPLDEIVATLDAWIEGDAWIVDGFGPLPCIEALAGHEDKVVRLRSPRELQRWLENAGAERGGDELDG